MDYKKAEELEKANNKALKRAKQYLKDYNKRYGEGERETELFHIIAHLADIIDILNFGGEEMSNSYSYVIALDEAVTEAVQTLELEISEPRTDHKALCEKVLEILKRPDKER